MSTDAHGMATTDSVHAELGFLRPIVGRPFSYGYEPTEREPPPTATFEAHRVEIHNARSASNVLRLETHGARLVDYRTQVTDFNDDAQLVNVYYPEAAEAIRLGTGASRVVVFDHNVRRGLSLPMVPDRYHDGRPVLHAHTDYTEASAVRRLRDLFGAEADAYLRHRFMQVNLWRPIRGPLRDSPLAVCDASSIGPDGLVAVDLRYPERKGEIYYLAHNPSQRWYFAPDMQPDEAWLLKNFDSAVEAPARFAAHSAFNDPTQHSWVRPRESIEVRAFAFFA